MQGSKTTVSHWASVWSEKQPTNVSWFQPEPAPSLTRIDALGLRKDAGIVDIGGGASPLVDRLLERGFVHVAVLDIAEAGFHHAVERLGPLADDVTWIEADVTQWQPVPGLFDLWHDRAVFHFLTEPGQQQAYARVLDRALSPDGTAIIATFAPDGPEKCSGLPVSRHDGASLSSVLGPGFRLIEERREDHVTPGGAVQKFCWCVFRRA